MLKLLNFMSLYWEPLSLKSVLDKHNVIKRAETDGSNNIPAENDSFSAVEKEINSSIYNHYNAELRKSQETIVSIEKKLQDCNNLTKSNGHTQLFSSEKSDWIGIKESFYLQLDAYKNKYDIAKKKIRDFRVQNDILAGREPAVRSTWKLLLAILIPISMGAVEITSNIFVLAPVTGGSEAIAYSLIVSCINIGFAFFLGRMCFTNIMHPVRTSSPRYLYFIFIFFVLCLIAYVNLFMGVFRGANELAQINFTDLAEAERLATEALQRAVWPFANLEYITTGSTQLLLIGLTFSFFSMVDGYFFDDPINGYGSLGRKVARSKELLQKHIEDGRSILEDFKTEAKLRLRGKRNLRHEANNLWSELINELQNANETTFNLFTKDLEGVLHDAIESYRAKNKVFRSSPTPSFMSETIDKSWLDVSFSQTHSSISHEVKTDPERKEAHGQNSDLINHEYETTCDKYDEFFNSERDELYQKLRGVDTDD